jgi:peptide/nickel transport system permease protein
MPATGRLDPHTLIDLHTNFMLIDPWLMSGWSFAQRLSTFLDALHHLILPALTQASWPLAIIARITRASVIEASHQDYVRTARAKGLGERYIQAHHIMPNAWLPIVTIIGLQIGAFLGGSVLTETVFAWNGLGSWVAQAIAAREYFIIQSTILIFALIFLLVNLLVDLFFAWLNPRIHYG